MKLTVKTHHEPTPTQRAMLRDHAERENRQLVEEFEDSQLYALTPRGAALIGVQPSLAD